MIHNWFEVKVSYMKTQENGTDKKVKETYLFDALSCTEAEARAIEEISPYIRGEFTVSDIKRANYSELFFAEEDSADRWFKCKVLFITLDEKSGTEKKSSTYMLVQASYLRDAIKKLDKGMEGSMADYQIAGVNETAIMDVYLYVAKEEVEDEVEDDDSDVTYSNTIDEYHKNATENDIVDYHFKKKEESEGTDD